MDFLTTDNVVKRFSGTVALKDVTINVPEGKIFGLLGPNGAGKTTLIRIINRIMAPDSGEVLFSGRPSAPDDIYRIGYMPEERGLYKKMKVGEQAIYLSRLKGLSYAEAKRRLTLWFEKFSIMSWWNKRLEELSKGMQQKVQFIITVIHEPELLIFDEPFSGFDPINTALLKDEILELKKAGKTIIFSTHNMSSVEEICDRIALINKAEVVLDGEVRHIREQFRTNSFRVVIPGSKGDIKGICDATILKVEEKQGTVELYIQKSDRITNSELVSRLAMEHEILSFAEELPSMNEVFINTVSGKNTTQR
ncbi:MAG: ATP-binding cassette domain-containing protein [Tannerellaceae bacterium]|jgi:ABC-2 type transport system ATP-binding protein|nr:ATP-binding cassette domain-containing protein [Tannerellaceae bacterium]